MDQEAVKSEDPAVLASKAGAPVKEIVAAISEAVVSFAGSEAQADDFTILAVARTNSK